MKTGFVFDLDGTLVDSIPGIARGLNLALKSLGYPEHSVNAIRGMVGRGARELCLASLKGCFNGEVPEEAFEAVHRGFMREYPHTWQDGTVPYPGIREMLLELGRCRPPPGRSVQQASCGHGTAGAPYPARGALPGGDGLFRTLSAQAGA